jgi:cytochrome c1
LSDVNALPSIAGWIGNRLTGLRQARRSFVALALVIVALLAVVAACSGVDDSGTTKDTLATQAARRAQVPSPIAASPGASPGGSPGAPAPLPAGDAAAGQALYSSQGCQGCHSVDGSKVVGPSWKGIYGHQVELEDGTTVTADDAYIHESIVQPQAKIVKGFTSVQMPPFPSMTDQQVADIIAYMKTLE